MHKRDIITVMAEIHQPSPSEQPDESFSRQAEVAMDQGISTPYIERQRQLLDGPNATVEAVRAAIQQSPKLSRGRGYSSQFERGTPSGADVSRQMANLDAQADPGVVELDERGRAAKEKAIKIARNAHLLSIFSSDDYLTLPENEQAARVKVYKHIHPPHVS